MPASRHHRIGLTLIELLVVLGIFGVLVGLLLTAVQRARETANVALCQHNLRELTVAVHSYHDHNGAMPPYATGRAGEIFGGWFVHLLPFVGQTAMYNTIKTESEPAVGDDGVVIVGPAIAMDGIRDAVFPILLCPSDTSSTTGGLTNYLANWYALTDGTQGAFAPARKFADLCDGLSNTVLFAEAFRECDGLPRLALMSLYHHNFGVTQEEKASDDPKYLPIDYTMFQVQPQQCDKLRTQTRHAAMNVAMAAGDVRTFAADVDPATWKALLKPSDGLPAGDWR